MPVMVDRFGGAHTTHNGACIEPFGDAVFCVLAHRAAAEPLSATFAADPGLVAAHALKGLGTVLLGKAENFKSGKSLAKAAKAALDQVDDGGTAGECALVAALELAAHGHLRRAAERLEAHVKRAPRDLLALKLSNALRFMCGDRGAMVAVTRAALPVWHEGLPGNGFLLGLHAFGLEECGHFCEAERVGRMSVDQEPADSWGIHAVGHVLEMQGRTDEGIAWFEASKPVWPACNNFAYHLAWHLALFRLEIADYDEVLRLYDTEIRPAQTDDFRDMSNAVSLLWRLEQEGVSVGSRWQGLYEIALKRRSDTSYVFASLHYLMALIAVGDDAAAAELVAALKSSCEGTGEQCALASGIGFELGNALVQLSEPAGGPEAICNLRQAFGRIAREMPVIGGSHAQRDVFVRSLADLAVRSGDRAGVETVSRARHMFRKADRFDQLIEKRLRVGVLPKSAELIPQHGAH